MNEGNAFLTGQHVLLVEDDAIVGLGLQSYLEELGATVRWAAGVEDALSHIDGGPAFDKAIVDLNLDGVMSTPVIERLLQEQVYTILCTGYDGSSIDERFRALPRTEKPFTRRKMRSLLAGR